MQAFRFTCEAGVLALAVLLSGCAAPAPPSRAIDTPGSATASLVCPLSSNCVNSLDSAGIGPLRYEGTPAAGMARLQAVQATFPEAEVVRTDTLSMEAIFTTAAGFRDQVDFRIDAQEQRIDFRSRSLFGLFDWGKNRSRMQALATRFDRQGRP